MKAGKLESALYLKNDCGFPITFQNGIGNTVLHNAITGQDPKFVKLVIIEKYESSFLDNPTSLSDIKGNLR